MVTHLKSARRCVRRIEALCPRTPGQLDRFLRAVLKMRVPRKAIVEGHHAPFDYLAATFFEDRSAGGKTGTDLLVWASRGGGKTHLGAMATLLDLLFKPGIQIRILGGSMEQSRKMFVYLTKMFDTPALRGTLADEPTHRGLELVNGSAVELLSQSQRSVRGTRVHKLRCDEVEEFEPEIWQAAQMVTRSGDCGGVPVRGTIEAISTMHHPFGLMSELVGRAGGENPRQAAARNGSGGGGIRLLRWCALDVVERCPPERACGGCVLWKDCRGRAKGADGFVPVDDLVSQWFRSSDTSWDSEMMCHRPTVRDNVFAMFKPEKHVSDTGPGGGKTTLVAGLRSEQQDYTFEKYRPELFEEIGDDPDSYEWIAGMDFGFRSPLVMLWGRLIGGGNPRDSVLEIVDEYVESGMLVEQHLRRIEARGWPKPAWLGVDPAGGQRNSQTGRSEIQLLRQRGYKVRSRRGSVAAGVELVSRRLDRGLLRIDARCKALIRGMTEYHFDTKHPQNASPVKDGPDHVCDALRYLIVNLDLGTGTGMSVGRYL